MGEQRSIEPGCGMLMCFVFTFAFCLGAWIGFCGFLSKVESEWAYTNKQLLRIANSLEKQ